MVGDCLDIILTEDKRINYDPVDSEVESIKNMEDVVSKYYINVTALDKPGIFQTITGMLDNSNISIESITQKNKFTNKTVPIMIVTHETVENKIQRP